MKTSSKGLKSKGFLGRSLRQVIPISKREGQASLSSRDCLVNCCFRRAFALSTLLEDWDL
jgi:hypothetical protein